MDVSDGVFVDGGDLALELFFVVGGARRLLKMCLRYIMIVSIINFVTSFW